MKFLITSFSLILFLSACQPTPYYDEELLVDPLGWVYDNKKIFEVDIIDTQGYYDMHLNIKHDNSYSYQNMYMKVTTSFPDQEDKQEQLSIDIAEKNGQWIGKCSGDKCELKVYMLEKFKFASPGKYSFAFEQYGRDASLKGIEEIGLTLYEVEK